MGSRTFYAIRAYERAQGLPVDGQIDQQLLAKLGLQ
jgi:peptidoglycan hydrolase-like protein with peptidoglycan-binding domain